MIENEARASAFDAAQAKLKQQISSLGSDLLSPELRSLYKGIEVVIGELALQLKSHHISGKTRGKKGDKPTPAVSITSEEMLIFGKVFPHIPSMMFVNLQLCGAYSRIKGKGLKNLENAVRDKIQEVSSIFCFSQP